MGARVRVEHPRLWLNISLPRQIDPCGFMYGNLAEVSVRWRLGENPGKSSNRLYQLKLYEGGNTRIFTLFSSYK